MNEEQYNELSDLADKFFSQFDNDIKLIKTCDAYPEQYNAFYGGKQVGYLRVRHGVFQVFYPDANSEEVIFEVDTIKLSEFDDSERVYYLESAKMVIMAKIKVSTIPNLLANWEEIFNKNNDKDTNGYAHPVSQENCVAWGEDYDCCLQSPWINFFIKELLAQKEKEIREEYEAHAQD